MWKGIHDKQVNNNVVASTKIIGTVNDRPNLTEGVPKKSPYTSGGLYFCPPDPETMLVGGAAVGGAGESLVVGALGRVGRRVLGWGGGVIQ